MGRVPMNATGRGREEMAASVDVDGQGNRSQGVHICVTCSHAMIVRRGSMAGPLTYCKLMKVPMSDVAECEEHAERPSA